MDSDDHHHHHRQPDARPASGGVPEGNEFEWADRRIARFARFGLAEFTDRPIVGRRRVGATDFGAAVFALERTGDQEAGDFVRLLPDAGRDAGELTRRTDALSARLRIAPPAAPARRQPGPTRDDRERPTPS